MTAQDKGTGAVPCGDSDALRACGLSMINTVAGPVAHPRDTPDVDAPS